MPFLQRILLLLFVVFSSTSLSAQIRSFSSDSAEFINEFETFMKAAGQKKINDDVKIFKLNWSTGKFTPEQRKSITRICNNMLAEKMGVQPYFETFMRAMGAFLSNKLPDKSLNQWQTLTNNMLGKGNRDYGQFLEMIANLFESNTIYKDENKAWTSDNRDYDILYEKGIIMVKFSKLKLSAKGPADQIEINNTSGIYYPGTNTWVGKGGTLGFRYNKEDNPFVELKNYQLKLQETDYHYDSVLLNYPKYFGTKIPGTIEDHLSLVTDTAVLRTYNFPKYVAYSNILEIKNIVGPLATFKGGFTIEGTSISTRSKNGQPTEINIYFKEKKKATLRSDGFRIANGIASTQSGSFVLFIDSGNVYHPNSNILFNFKENTLKVSRQDKGLMRVPFTDDYHKLEMDVQEVKWKITEPFVDFDNNQNDKEAKFASQDFFNDILYIRMQGGLMTNPLQSIYAFYNQQPEDAVVTRLTKEIKDLKSKRYNPKNFSERAGDSLLVIDKLKQLADRKKLTRGANNSAKLRFSTKDWAAFVKSQPADVQTSMYEMHDKGYVTYLPGPTAELDSAVILPKLIKHVQNHEKTRDYDVIRLSSVIGKRANATLNLLGNDLNVEGVQKFFFSDSQNVIIVPTEQQIKIKKNRRLYFGGTIRAGRFDFYGQKFEFDYDKFQILYSNIDSMRLYFPDSTGRAIVPIKSVLRNIYGTLYIDKPNNKSGLMNYPEYPIFVSDKGADILYDKPHIHGGAYKSDKFKFEADPFTIDSLDNFTLSGLQFDGTFYSADIFPVFRHKASIQKDYSLGFTTPTPAGGYPMYKGAGKGEMMMSLSEEGFYGLNGKIEYAGSTTQFKKILLLPDKAVGEVDRYDIAQTGIYPEVHGKDVKLEWSPYTKEMNVAQGESPFKMFKTGYDFYGKINQTPGAVKGDGTLKWKEADFRSKEQVFGTNKTTAKSAALNIYAADSTKIAFQTMDVNGNVDFDKQLGTFTTNVIGSQTKFPFNAYITNLNDYKWNMAAKTIEAKTGPAMAGTKPYFLSSNPDQDSLMYEGKSATYDLNKYTLAIKGVPYIDIVDSRLFPNRGDVMIREGAVMDPLDSAKILANRIDNFHDIYSVKITVLGRTKFKGTGKYQYVNMMGVRQEFRLDSITAKDKKYLEGWGRVDESQNFTLDTKIGYHGSTQIISNERNIRFLGLVKPLHTFTYMPESNWIRFDGRVDPKNVIIDIADPRNKDKAKQFVGLFVAFDSSHVYPMFFGRKHGTSDLTVTSDTGIMYYDHAKESFMAGNKSKLKDGSLQGQFIQFNEKNHTIHAEGPLDFGLDNAADSKVKFKNAGTADLKVKDTAFTFNLAMMLDFPMNKDVQARIVEMFKTSGSSAVNVNNEFFKMALGEMISDEKNAKVVIKNLEKTGVLSGKDEADYRFILSDATFRWDTKLRGMYCNDVVTMVNIGGTSLNMDIKVTSLLESKNRAQYMHFYFDLGGGEWIYFRISKNRAEMLSSDQKLNELWVSTAEKTSGEGFSVSNTTQKMVDRFLKKFPEGSE